MKVDRKIVYDKYDGHCAYCGKEITIDEMQVDHIVPKRAFEIGYEHGNPDDIDNLNPSCRLCNHYKRAESIEHWRQYFLDRIIENLNKIYIFRVALRFGMIEIKGWDRKFYFEKHKTK